MGIDFLKKKYYVNSKRESTVSRLNMVLGLSSFFFFFLFSASEIFFITMQDLELVFVATAGLLAFGPLEHMWPCGVPGALPRCLDTCRPFQGLERRTEPQPLGGGRPGPAGQGGGSCPWPWGCGSGAAACPQCPGQDTSSSGSSGKGTEAAGGCDTQTASSGQPG